MDVGFLTTAYEYMGQEYLSATLKRAGHNTQLFWDPRLFDDGFLYVPSLARLFRYHDALVDQICKSSIKLLAVTSVTDMFQGNLRIVEDVKHRRPDITVAFGGLHATGAPEAVAKKWAIDFACVGEGEAAITALVDDLAHGGDGRSAPNLVYEVDGQIHRNALAPLEDLDALPWPDKDLFYRINPWYRGSYQIISTRNCPNACTFCHNSLWRKIYRPGRRPIRRRSVDNVIAELRWAKRQYDLKCVKFFDEVFVYDKVWLAEFAEKYARHVGLPYWCYVYAGHVDRDVMQMLKESGCWESEMGVQSIRPEIRGRILNRHESNEQIEQAIAMFREAKIQLVVDNIFGLPGQDLDELREAGEFYNEHRPNRFKCYWLRYFPGTTILPRGIKSGQLEQEDLQLLDEGGGSRSLATGGTNAPDIFVQVQTWFVFLLALPKWVNRTIGKYRLYRFMPPMHPFVGHAIGRSLDLFDREQQYEVTGTRFVRRYRKYWLRVLMSRRHSLTRVLEEIRRELAGQPSGLDGITPESASGSDREPEQRFAPSSEARGQNGTRSGVGRFLRWLRVQRAGNGSYQDSPTTPAGR